MSSATTLIQSTVKAKRRGRVVALATLKAREYPKVAWGERYQQFFGLPGYTFSMLIYGLPGSGKSTLVYNIANDLAHHHGRVLINSAEEGFQDTAAERVGKLDASLSKRLHIGDRLDFDQLCQRARDGRYRVVVIDSIQAMRFTIDHFHVLKEDRLLKRKAYILLSQATASGGIKGETDLLHEVDIKCKAYDGMLEVRSRYLPAVNVVKLFSIVKEPTLFNQPS